MPSIWAPIHCQPATLYIYIYTLCVCFTHVLAGRSSQHQLNHLVVQKWQHSVLVTLQFSHNRSDCCSVSHGVRGARLDKWGVEQGLLCWIRELDVKSWYTTHKSHKSPYITHTLPISTSIYIYIYIYIRMCTDGYTHTDIYIYIHNYTHAYILIITHTYNFKIDRVLNVHY